MIGGTFEYLMSSLPNLSFQKTDEARQRVLGLLEQYAGGAAEKLSPTRMLDGEARKFLPAGQFSLFQKITLRNLHEPEFQEGPSQVVADFSSFTLELKKELEQWRILQKENAKKTVESELAKRIGEGTPLEIEVRLLNLQWDALEEFSVGHFADAEALFAYKIKLMILLRWWSFNPEKGFKRFLKMTTKKAAWPTKS